MQLNRNNWKFSIFIKLILSFMLVMMPIYLLSKLVNNWGADIVRQEISQSLFSKVHFYKQILEKEIDRLAVLQREYVNDDDLLALSIANSEMFDYEQSAAMKRIQKKIKLIKNSSIYIDQVSVFVPSVRRIISSEELTEVLSRSKLDDLMTNISDTHSTLRYMQDKMFIHEMYPSPLINPYRDPLFILEIELSLAELQSFLYQLSGYEGGGSALIHKDWVVANKQGEEPNSEFVEGTRAMLAEALSSSGDIEFIKVNKQTYMYIYEYSSILDAVLAVYVPEKEILGTLKKYKYYTWLLTAVSILVIIVFSYWLFRIIHRPLRKLVHAFHKVESGNMLVTIHHGHKDEFHYLYEQFNSMVDKLKTLIYEVYEQKIQAQQAELKQLQLQINPHFLYNGFYILYRMAKAQDFENSVKFTKYLGDYFRYITRHSSDVVSLEEELNHVGLYAKIQNVRFADRIEYALETPPEAYKKLQVPKLILQPIIENAYNHGLENMDEGGQLHLFFDIQPNRLHIRIEDNGLGMSDSKLEEWNRHLFVEEKETEVSGMINVHRRLKLKYGQGAGIVLSRTQSGGLRVTMVIILEKVNEQEDDHV